MNLLSFAVTVVSVSASGVLSPGPLLFATLSHSAKSGVRGGLAVSVGHTIVEFPLVILLSIGALSFISEPIFNFYIRIIGGVVLLVFGFMQLYTFFRPGKQHNKKVLGNPLLIGLAFTGFNPYFIVWWLTVGWSLIVEALSIAFMFGVLLMFILHVWMDYTWLMFVAYVSKKGIDILGTRGYKFLIALSGTVLIYFGFLFIASPL